MVVVVWPRGGSAQLNRLICSPDGTEWVVWLVAQVYAVTVVLSPLFLFPFLVFGHVWQSTGLDSRSGEAEKDRR